MKKILILTTVLASIFGCSSEPYINDDPIILWADTITVKSDFADTLVLNANRFFLLQSITNLHQGKSYESNKTYDTVSTYATPYDTKSDLILKAIYKDPNKLEIILTENKDTYPGDETRNRNRLNKINVSFEDSWGYIIIQQEAAPATTPTPEV